MDGVFVEDREKQGADEQRPLPVVQVASSTVLTSTWEKDEDGTWYLQGPLPLR